MSREKPPSTRMSINDLAMLDRINQLQLYLQRLSSALHSVMPGVTYAAGYPPPIVDPVLADDVDTMCYKGHGPQFVDRYTSANDETRLKMLADVSIEHPDHFVSDYTDFVTISNINDFLLGKRTFLPRYSELISGKRMPGLHGTGLWCDSFENLVQYIDYSRQGARQILCVNIEDSVSDNGKYVSIQHGADHFIFKMTDKNLTLHSRFYWSVYEKRWLHLKGKEKNVPGIETAVLDWAVTHLGFQGPSKINDTDLRLAAAYIADMLYPDLKNIFLSGNEYPASPLTIGGFVVTILPDKGFGNSRIIVSSNDHPSLVITEPTYGTPKRTVGLSTTYEDGRVAVKDLIDVPNHAITDSVLLRDNMSPHIKSLVLDELLHYQKVGVLAHQCRERKEC